MFIVTLKTYWYTFSSVYNISKYKWQRHRTENDPLNYIYKKVMDSEMEKKIIAPTV